jgi:hypothetical protein
MKRHLVGKKVFAEMVGVTLAAVSTACSDRSKSKLSAALVGKLINANHPSALLYTKTQHERRSRSAKKLSDSKKPKVNTAVVNTKRKQKHHRNDGQGFDSDPSQGKDSVYPTITIQGEEIPPEEWLDMPLISVVQRFGTAPQFRDWVAATKQLISITKEFINVKQARGEYMSRDHVARYVIPLVDNAFNRLVGDLPENVTTQIYGMVQSGAEEHEVKAYLRENISKTIKDVKQQVITEMDKS